MNTNRRHAIQMNKLKDEFDRLYSKYTDDITPEEHEKVSTAIDQVIQQQKDLLEVRYGKKESWVSKIDPNVIITGAVSILSVTLMLKYEEENIIVTKAFGIATKWLGK